MSLNVKGSVVLMCIVLFTLFPFLLFCSFSVVLKKIVVVVCFCIILENDQTLVVGQVKHVAMCSVTLISFNGPCSPLFLYFCSTLCSPSCFVLRITSSQPCSPLLLLFCSTLCSPSLTILLIFSTYPSSPQFLNLYSTLSVP